MFKIMVLHDDKFSRMSVYTVLDRNDTVAAILRAMKIALQFQSLIRLVTVKDWTIRS